MSHANGGKVACLCSKMDFVPFTRHRSVKTCQPQEDF
jgi:hypothetical protein